MDLQRCLAQWHVLRKWATQTLNLDDKDNSVRLWELFVQLLQRPELRQFKHVILKLVTGFAGIRMIEILMIMMLITMMMVMMTITIACKGVNVHLPVENFEKVTEISTFFELFVAEQCAILRSDHVRVTSETQILQVVIKCIQATKDAVVSWQAVRTITFTSDIPFVLTAVLLLPLGCLFLAVMREACVCSNT